MEIINSQTPSNGSKYSFGLDRGDRVGFGALTVMNVQYEDRGVYSCTVVNILGEVSADATLTVHGKFCLVTE